MLDAISFSRRHNGPAVKYENHSSKTVVVEEDQSQVVGLWGGAYQRRQPEMLHS